MTTITEDYVSFETAKLLKEKGFDWECLAHWFIGTERNFSISKTPQNWNEVKTDLDWLSCPTHQMACKWLREVYKLHIGIARGPKGYHITIETIPLGVVKYITREIVGTTYIDSYEEAVEAALKYTIENLI